jgi:hypothetical protein
LINIETNKKQVIQLIEKDKYDLSSFPKVIDGYYVKYLLNKDGKHLNYGESFGLDENKTLYYSSGIKDDYFNIKFINNVFIYCDSKIETKEKYVDCNIVISDGGSYIDADAKIKLRGNSTLWVDKKAYKIKFNDKQNLLNMGNDKEWALLANYFDPTHLRNYYAYMLASALGLEYTCECRFVEVYINDVYNGLYLLSETVKTGEERVDIEEETTYSEVPFLLELDMKLTLDNPNYRETIDDEMFLINNSKYNGKTYPFGTKYPDSFKDLKSNQYEYIKDYINNMFKSVRCGNYEDYIDVESFINYFLIQELFMNPDLDYSSVYMYKKLGEKLKFGPTWDFDLSSGNAGYVEGYSYNRSMKDINGGSYLFNELYNYDEFKSEFKDRLTEINLDILPALFDSIEYNYSYLAMYAKNDNDRWGVLNDKNWARPVNLVGISYREQVEYFKQYLALHNEWMQKYM